jgi:hypothetical protein
MKFMLMEFASQSDLKAKSRDWNERMVSFMVRLEDELAARGELVYSEVLEFGDFARLVDRHGRIHTGSFTGTGSPLFRYWVVSVPGEERALQIAASIAEVVEAAVEVRECRRDSLRP